MLRSLSSRAPGADGLPDTARVARIVRNVAANSPATAAMRIDDVVCPGGTCPAALDGRLVRYDGIHYR